MNQHESDAGPAQWVAGLWEYYRGYTRTAVHAAATAALTAFGLLIFIDPLFAILAILSYLTPPIALYTLGTDLETGDVPSESDHDRATPMTNVDEDSKTTRMDDDSDSDGNDTDSDGDDGDSDSDGDDGDTDSDGADADTDG